MPPSSCRLPSRYLSALATTGSCGPRPQRMSAAPTIAVMPGPELALNEPSLPWACFKKSAALLIASPTLAWSTFELGASFANAVSTAVAMINAQHANKQTADRTGRKCNTCDMEAPQMREVAID